MKNVAKNTYINSLLTYEFLVLSLMWVGINLLAHRFQLMGLYWTCFGMVVLVFMYHNVNYFLPEYFLKKKLGPYFAFMLLEALVVMVFLFVVEHTIRRTSRWDDAVVVSVLLGYICSLVYAVIRYIITKRYFKVIAHKAQLQAELSSLQNQINPHFYFNSLNHLYGTALEEGSPRTAHAIQQFSNIMRHITEEGSKELIPVEKEIQFLRDYVEFQREKIAPERQGGIKSTIEWDEHPANVLPLLIVNFIENAFKYGVSQHHEFFIHIYLYCRQGKLELFVDNSKHSDLNSAESTSIGLINVRKRLELFYPENYRLEVTDLPNVYKVALTIDLLNGIE